MKRLFAVGLTSVLMNPALAWASVCGESLFFARPSAVPKSVELVQIYTPANPIDGSAISIGLLADIFGELHRLQARSPEAFAHLVKLVQLAEVETMVPMSLRSTFAVPRTAAPVEANERLNLWHALAERTDDSSVADILRELRLIDEDGHLMPFVREVLAAAMSTVKYTSMDDIWSGTTHAFSIVPIEKLADCVRYAPARTAARMYDPLARGLMIEKPQNFHFPPFGYSKTLSF